MGTTKPRAVRGRKPSKSPRKRYLAIRVSEEEHRWITEAAGGYPPATWARIELVRLARARLGKGA